MIQEVQMLHLRPRPVDNVVMLVWSSGHTDTGLVGMRK
jgi:hypothetical protein